MPKRQPIQLQRARNSTFILIMHLFFLITALLKVLFQHLRDICLGGWAENQKLKQLLQIQIMLYHYLLPTSKTSPNLEDSRMISIYYLLYLFYGPVFWEQLRWAALTHEFSDSQLGLQSSEGLTGAGEVIRKMTASYGQQLASPRASNPRNKGGRHNAFYDLVFKAIHHYLCYTRLVTQTRPASVCKETTQGHKYKVATIVGTSQVSHCDHLTRIQ